MGAVASVIFKMHVFLREIAHLAAGAEWEPSGAVMKTVIFCVSAIPKFNIFLKECVHLAMGAEQEPSGANTNLCFSCSFL